jgi:hypothetical protein
MAANSEERARILGIRAEPTAIHWAVVSGASNGPTLEASDTETAPNAFNEGEVLAWIRQKVLYIIDSYKPRGVAIRYPEGNAMASTNSAKARCRVEGVALEAAASKNLRTVTGVLNTFGKHLGTKSAKAELEADDLRGLDWSNKGVKDREAILVAVSLLSSD